MPAGREVRIIAPVVSSARTVCVVAAAAALAGVLTCGGGSPSPVAPVIGAPFEGDAVWFDPTNRAFYLDEYLLGYLVGVNDDTQFVGALPNVQDMSATYASGHRLSVRVLGTTDTKSSPWRIMAFSVDAQVVATDLRTFGGPGDAGCVGFSQPQINRLALCARWGVFVTPSTIFDPSGDFPTFDSLIAAMGRDEVKYISGEGWQVAWVGTLARTMKATRQPQ
jgi:hypothetical protein